jgi:hypothetical protein
LVLGPLLLLEAEGGVEVMKESVADSSNDSRWWTALWRLNVPPKVRIFLVATSEFFCTDKARTEVETH